MWEKVLTGIAATWLSILCWMSENQAAVSAAAAAVSAIAAVVFGFYQVRIGRFTRQAALAAEQATNAAIRLEQPVLRIWDPEIVATDGPIGARQPYGCTEISGNAESHMAFTKCQISNFGRTHCEIYNYAMGYSVGNEIPSHARYKPIESSTLPSFLAANGEETIHLHEYINISDIDLEKLNNGSKFRVYLRIKFADFMGNVHITRAAWCWDTVYGEDQYDLVREASAPIDE